MIGADGDTPRSCFAFCASVPPNCSIYARTLTSMQARLVCPNLGEEYTKVTRGAHGAVDFRGNVWEWTSTVREDGTEYHYLITTEKLSSRKYYNGAGALSVLIPKQ